MLQYRNFKIVCDSQNYAVMGRVGSTLGFHFNLGSGRVGSLTQWVRLGRVEKIGVTSNSDVMLIHVQCVYDFTRIFITGTYRALLKRESYMVSL